MPVRHSSARRLNTARSAPTGLLFTLIRAFHRTGIMRPRLSSKARARRRGETSGESGVVPAIDRGVPEGNGGTHRGPHPAQITILDQLEEPLGEQRGHRFGQPLPKPEVAYPVTGPRRLPLHGFRHGRLRTRLEEVELISGDHPLDVLRGSKVCLHAPRQLGDLDCLLRGDGALALSPAGSLVALYHPLVTHRLARD